MAKTAKSMGAKTGKGGLSDQLSGHKGAGGGEAEASTSIFDPVLCELVYRWFCPPRGVVLDPFAGGSVRGIVAAKLGLDYVGIDLRPEQVQANGEQALEIFGDEGCSATWICGDSSEVLLSREAIGWEDGVDLVFSCPPYADLEVYSNDPRDLSNMDYRKFRSVYAEIIEGACYHLKDDRFAVFVVGDARGKDGCYYGFPWHTVEAFQAAGLKLYNEAVLVTPAGSLPARARKGFEASRKLGKSHQNVFVFVKGDPVKATQAIGTVDFGAGDTLGEAWEGDDPLAGLGERL